MAMGDLQPLSESVSCRPSTSCCACAVAIITQIDSLSLASHESTWQRRQRFLSMKICNAAKTRNKMAQVKKTRYNRLRKRFIIIEARIDSLD